MLSAALVVATLVFVRMLQGLQVGTEARRAMAIVVDASAVVRSTTLTEEEKQTRVQEAAIASFASFLSLLLRMILAFVGATLVVALGAFANLYALQDVIAAATDWTSLLAPCLAAVAAWLLWR